MNLVGQDLRSEREVPESVSMDQWIKQFGNHLMAGLGVVTLLRQFLFTATLQVSLR